MTTENQREAAQLEQRDAPKFALGEPRLLVGHILGEPNGHGFQVRALRLATAEDVERLTAQ